MMISKAARFAALLVCGSVLATASPSFAQAPAQQPAARQPAGQQPAQPARRFNLSRQERDALVPLEQAVQAAQGQGQGANWAPVAALLPAAQAAARGNDARYLVTKFQYAVAVGTNNMDLQEQALNGLATNPGTPANEIADAQRELARLKNVRAERAFAANDFATAERLYLELQQANPNDQRVTNNLAIVRGRMGNAEGALEPLLQQIRTAEASGGRAPEATYRRARDTYYTARNSARALELAIQLARHYPTATNWRDAALMYRQFANPDNSHTLASYRFQRASNSLSGEGDYLTFLQMLRSGGFAGETKAVAEAGVAAGAFTRQRQGVGDLISWADQNAARDQAGLAREATEARANPAARRAVSVGDAYYGYGRYREAADMYRAALSKTGANRDLINLNLGAALAMANQRAEAEAALRAVTGQTAGLANLWLAWLARSQG